MDTFDSLYKEYEATKNGDVFGFYQKHSENRIALRFLLIRSIDKSNLKKLLQDNNLSANSNKGNELMQSVYDSIIKTDDIVNFIEKRRDELINQREQEVSGLKEILKEIPITACGVRNDNVNTIIESFVRNKKLKTYNALSESLEKTICRLKNYCLWSYYNQTTNDIIELFFLKHQKVIPTLRKVHGIDFFLKIENDIVPFDLKITHISDDFFELMSKGGIVDSNNSTDSFEEASPREESELEKIKSYYKKYKKEHRNEQLKPLDEFNNNKNLLANYISTLGDSQNFIENMKTQHEKYVPTTSESLKKLEWWNYKYQGDRLFCNNNRFFVFLAYKTKFEDGKVLKGRIDKLGVLINKALNDLTQNSIHTIKYKYKNNGLEGNYTAYAISTIYTE